MAEIVHCERRQHEGEPGGLDRLAAEMAEVGVERLRPGHGQEHGAERDQADLAVAREEFDAIGRVERQQDSRIGADLKEPGQCDGEEPDHHDRAEKRRHLRRAARLHREQGKQDHNCQRHHVRLEGGRDDLEAFDRGQYRQRRREYRIAIEQGGADDAEQHDRGAAFAECALRQRHERQRAALAIIVGIEQDHDVFQRDGDDQRPQDEREHAEHGGPGRRAAGADGRHDGFPERIEGAGSDVAVNDADAAERQRCKPGCGMRLAVDMVAAAWRLVPLMSAHHTVTCVPTSTTLPVGMRKKSVASLAPLASPMKSRS